MPARSAWPPLLVAAGLVAGLIVAVSEPTLFRARTTLALERSGKPVADPALAQTFAQLVRSDILLRNAAQRLGGPVDAGRLHVHAGEGSVEIAYDASTSVQAARVAQELAVGFEQAVTSRFGASGDRVAVFDPPHPAGRVSPHILRDAALGLLAGLVAGAIAWKRPRGRGLRERGRWRVGGLADLVEAGALAHPDRVEDWRAYVAVLRAQADENDLLPYTLDRVVREVFAPLLPTRS